MNGYLLAGGGRIHINGPIGGDARLAGGEIELGPKARIQGSLRYGSPNELRRSPGAIVVGTVERLPMQEGERGAGFPSVTGLLVWCLGLAVLAAVLLAALPALAEGVSTAARAQPGRSLLFGLNALVTVPVAAVLALVTVIGIPIGVLALLAFPALLLLGYVLGAVALAELALHRMQPNRANERGRRIVAAFIMLLILGLLAQVPFLGGVVGLLVLLLGSGALLRQFRQTSTPAPA